jgi:hypothetical protein
MEMPGEQRLWQHLRGAAGSSAAPRSLNHPLEPKDFPQVDSDAGVVPTSGSGATKRKRLTSGKCTKEEVKVVKQRECTVRAQTLAAADMAAANKQKAQVLQDQAALNLFTMPGANPTEVAEYLRLR